ncbi:MAG: tetratricopeptide repeat protein [Gammaproteobacteria bacterium]|nr:tetratricopeptide repeat protein [Gammaproteobacteria bacterium]
MTSMFKQKTFSVLCQYLVMIGATVIFAGCSATGHPQRKVANIEVQEAVGFTITEEVRIGDRVRGQYFEALNHLQEGRLEQGIAMLEEIAEAAPLVTAPRIDLGMAYRQQGDLEAAERNLLQALQLNANHPVAHNELGIVYRKTGRFAEAKQSYQAAIAVFPGYHHARRNLAILCDLYLADLGCALEQYEAYMTTVPADAEASMWIADLRNRMNQ